MINKQNLWFVTLFSLILILGIYYVALPNDLLEKATNIGKKVKDKVTIEEVKEESPLVAMRVSLEEERKEKMTVLEERKRRKNI